ncbi:hypothetical protein [Variovorax sp. dw_954]|uniref:hypothetical protein n=1 Tax=Variovorax sp. dw_954 TaxID=2720078 RepID=UPI001BD34595|nr:hypothetical protein [Variovorax sp. dw_954]
MKASPSARSWIAAGVRHELLTRALPALRHDMVAPVSVIRMGLLMLKRQVAADPIDASTCAQRVELVESQVGALVAGVRSLRDWELATADEGITRSALVAQCVSLMRAAYEMQGISLDVDPALAPVEGETHWPQSAALRYLLLGGMGHLHDSIQGLGAVRIAPEGARALRLTAVTHDQDSAPRDSADAHRAPRALAIDAIALQSLADDLGYAVTRDDSTLVLDFGAA